MKARKIVRAVVTIEIEMLDRLTDIAGSSLQGEIDAPYKDIVKAFGQPKNIAVDSTDGKTDVEWYGRANGQPFYIYNYKTGKNYLGPEGQAIKDITDWHIGAKTKATAEYVEAFFMAKIRPGRRAPATK